GCAGHIWHETIQRSGLAAGGSAERNSEDIVAPVPGKVTQCKIAAGVNVAAGEPLLILESMKMEFEVKAPKSGTIAKLLVKPGDQVSAGKKLADWVQESSMDPQIQQFLNSSGFKILALARLSSYEYSICLYLINCTVSGLDQIVTTEEELASLLGYTEDDISQALAELKSKNIIRLRYADKMHMGNNSLRLGLHYDTSRWTLTYDRDATSRDAIVFPFRRHGEVAFKVL